jgi:glycosyltransferase involved in cell wall biosynthesis
MATLNANTRFTGRLCLLTTGDPSDSRFDSGVPYRLCSAFGDLGVDLVNAGPLHVEQDWRHKFIARWYHHMHHRNYLGNLELLHRYGRVASRRLRQLKPDAVLALSSRPIAYLESHLPVVLWSDATFASLENFYPKFSRLCNRSRRLGHEGERCALSRADMIVFSNPQAAASARCNYHIPANKIRLVKRGISLTAPSQADLRKWIASRKTDNWSFVFIGRDWERKGGPVALEALSQVAARGYRVSLVIIGTHPPDELPAWAVSYGELDKARPEQSALFQELIRSSHFLLLPTLADTNAMALCEANLVGCPVITRAVGAIPWMFELGLTGSLLPAEATAQDFTDAILQSITDPDYAKRASMASRQVAENFSWHRTANELLDILGEVITSHAESQINGGNHA